MAGVLGNPLVVLGILVGNALLVALCCYGGLRNWFAQRQRQYNIGNNVLIPVRQYVIESNSDVPNVTNSHRQSFSSIRSIIIVGPGFTENETGMMRTSIENHGYDDGAVYYNVSDSDIDSSDILEDEPPPPKYSDIFPEKTFNHVSS